MRLLYELLRDRADTYGEIIAISDDTGEITQLDLYNSVVHLSACLASAPRVIGILAPNGREWVIAQLAAALAGKLVVPLPTFFADQQLGHIIADASVTFALVTSSTAARAQRLGTAVGLIESTSGPVAQFTPSDGFGQIIYTSGSTGTPKGVRHESGQILWSSRALASATGATDQDSYLSILPLPLLLETICAVMIPALVGARVHFDTRLAEGIGSGALSGIAASFAAHRPTMTVLVPRLLDVWTQELLISADRAPSSLRFVAVGGAAVADRSADTAVRLGIPVHEGYGLSECCSVVAVNRFGERRPGTVGTPLPGVAVSIVDGEIVVASPAIMDGYLGKAPISGNWSTGDLGQIDADGYLSVHGRKDNLIVTSLGRNISPEWIETMLLADPRIAFCAIVADGEPFLSTVLIPSHPGSIWFAGASDDQIVGLIADCCRSAPAYAVPRTFRIVSAEDAKAQNLLTPNGRIDRRRVAVFLRADAAQGSAAVSD